MYFKKVSVTERLPELNKFVTTIDEAGEHRVYRLVNVEPVGNSWNMRDADGINSSNNNLPITHWLEEVDLSEMEAKANKYDVLDEKISACYGKEDESGEWVEHEDNDSDLGTIGEIAARHFGWM
jgi:hypothetical protein